jgi:hypothetical protein
LDKAFDSEKDLFSEVSKKFQDLDPAKFIENNLTIDGEPFKILGNGWRPMVDIYRYIALQATKPDGKPVVLKKGRQVGGTVMAGALDLYFTNSGLFSKPPARVIHLFPASQQSRKFSQDKLEGMIRTAKDNFINKNKLNSANAVDNMTMKQFNTGTLWIDSVGFDADRIRGMTVDIAFYDEIQDMPQLAVGNASKILTAAKYGPVGKGVQVFFGTPKARSSFFYKIWENSDQRFFHLGCEKCNETYPFYLPEDDRWMDIWVEKFTIQCPLCQHRQHKTVALERGKWVSSGKPDAPYVGYHVNQLYIPYFSKENIIAQLPKNNPSMSERLWNNEVLGEFYSGAGLPLSKADIYDNCRDDDRSFANSIDQNQKITYMGVDWGGKADAVDAVGGQSFSCVVVISVDHNGVISVEHAHKLRKNSFDYKKETIKEIYRRFAIKRGVSDWFFGQDVVNDLQMIYRERFLGAQGSGSLINAMKYREDELIVTYNKDLLIEELFDLFKKGKVRMPWKSYDKIEWLIDHCTSMEMKQRVVGGQPIKTYVKGSIPNDGLMALMYAYMAYKFDATKGFTIRPGITKSIAMPAPVLAKVRL